MIKLGSNTKHIIFYLVLFLLFLPIIQQTTHFIKLTPLKGDIQVLDSPAFSFDAWFNGTYAIQKEEYCNQSFGLRSFFVRIYNQLYYTLFKVVNAKDVVIGKNNYLYEKNYIRAYLGEDFVGQEEIQKKVIKLQKICDTLKTKNIQLIVVLAPGKGSFYPEYIPEKHDLTRKKITNYEAYVSSLKNTRINVIDFHSWFIKMKPLSPYPLFPKNGIHWSHYGQLLAADSVVKYIYSKNNSPKKPNILIKKIEKSNHMSYSDDDIEQGMNLLFNIDDLYMGYPLFSFENTDFPQLKVLTIADSYYWGMFNFGLSKDLFNDGQFWYYNKQVYPDSYNKPIVVSDLDMIESVEKNNVILLLSTDANLYKFAFGFIDQLYDEYFSANTIMK